jgi:hypothetical protein
LSGQKAITSDTSKLGRRDVASFWRNLVKQTAYTFDGSIAASQTIKEYGSGAVSSRIHCITYPYFSDTSSAYKNKNILDRKTSKVVTDGVGNTIAQTQFEYDNYRSGRTNTQRRRTA